MGHEPAAARARGGRAVVVRVRAPLFPALPRPRARGAGRPGVLTRGGGPPWTLDGIQPAPAGSSRAARPGPRPGPIHVEYSPVSPHYEPYSAGMHEGRWQQRAAFGYKARSRPGAAGERPTGWVYGELGTEVSSPILLPQGDRSLTSIIHQRTTGELGTGAAEKRTQHAHSAAAREEEGFAAGQLRSGGGALLFPHSDASQGSVPALATHQVALDYAQDVAQLSPSPPRRANASVFPTHRPHPKAALSRRAVLATERHRPTHARPAPQPAPKPPKRPGLLELERKFKALQKPPRFRRTPSSGVDGEVWQLAGKLAGRRPAVHSGQGHYGAWTVADHAYKGYFY